MVGDQQQQHPQPQSIPLTAEEEALKRNTDCVYFLASPLTCKKGAECEYRHSDIARVNPRDCWYWLNGNCLNPKCAFRHPPLDGLLGPQALTPSGSSLPPSQTAATPVTSAPPTSGKLGVPCIFFQKGLCLKGDRCPFFHAPSFVNSKVPNGPVAAAVSEPPTIKKPFVRPAKCSTEPRVQEANVLNPTEVPFQAKPQSKFGTAPAKDVSSIERHVRQPSALDDHPPKYRQTTPPATNGNLINRSHRMQQVHISDDHETLNSRDADEISRDPSPGFDVLVDNELRETDYYHDEDHYGRTRGQEGRSLNPNDYDIGNSADYDSMVDVDQDMYHDARGYDSFDRMRGQYGREQRRASSERILGGSERRQYPRADSPEQIDGSDLRYHLSKQRKVNGLRSVISHDRGHDNYTGDRSYRGPSRRDSHHMPASERAVSNRLRGRIKLPGRSTSPGNESDLNPEREIERGTNWGRLSPGRLRSFTQQGRLQDRLKGKVLEDINNEGRSFRGSRMREINEDNFSFQGPKSLAELKGRKISESNKQPMSDYQQSITLGKRKYLESHQQSESDLSFEGPKPLSEILKRKKTSDGNGGDMRQNEEKENVRTRAGISSSVFKEEMDLPVHSRKEAMEDSKSTDGRYLHRNASDLQVEEGLIVDDDAMEDHEPESFGEGDGEFEYEQVEGEDYNEDEAENAEGEYVEDDDGDDFAKKIGVLLS